MKPLKKATQGNAVINKDYYTISDLKEMLKNQEIFYLRKFEISYEWYYGADETEEFRIFLNNKKEIKVILDEFGSYTTVCVSNSGKQYYISL